MRLILKPLCAIALSLCLVAPASALLPLAAGIAWLGNAVTAAAASSPYIVTALEASLYIHAGVIAYTSLFVADKAPDGSPASPALEVKLNNTAKRSNPDPSKWDDASGSSRDPTPKSSIPATSTGSPSDPQPALVGGAAGYESTCAGLGSVLGSTVGAVGQGCAVRGTSTYPQSCAKAYIVNSCTSSSCSITRPEMTDPYCNSEEATFTVTVNPVTLPQGLNCASGFATGAGTCLEPLSDLSCPAGYELSGSTCVLTNPAAVTKPANHPCEVIRTASGLQLDSSNPNCAGVQVQGNTVQIEQQAVTFNADNSVSVSNPNGYTTFQLGSDNSDGSTQIVGATRSGNPGSYGGISTGGGGTGGGTTGGTVQCGGVGQPACAGSGTGEGGSCGAPGQAKCSIDDSGFAGLEDFAAAGQADFDQANADRTSAVQSQTNRSNDLGIETSWLPQPSFNTACEPFVINYKVFNIAWNWCGYFPLLREVMAYLFYVFTALYLWGSFVRSTPSAR
jgi:hypothetical protein